MHTVTDYEIIRHGYDDTQSFLGCGVSATSYDHVVTGVGGTELEAFEDAINVLALQDVETEPLEAEGDSMDAGEAEEAAYPEMYCRVSIRYNLEDAA